MKTTVCAPECETTVFSSVVQPNTDARRVISTPGVRSLKTTPPSYDQASQGVVCVMLWPMGPWPLTT
jgi:hypothetical protein